MLTFHVATTENVNIKAIILNEYPDVWNKSGKTVVVNFWATWCAPCVKEIPELVAFSTAHHVSLKFVSLDRPKSLERAQKLLLTRGVSGTHYLLNVPDENLNKIVPDWHGAVPLTIIYHKGEAVKVFDHQVSQNELVQFYKTLKP